MDPFSFLVILLMSQVMSNLVTIVVTRDTLLQRLNQILARRRFRDLRGWRPAGRPILPPGLFFVR
jgi:hypothetical protein